jgi:hypothetical protein
VGGGGYDASRWTQSEKWKTRWMLVDDRSAFRYFPSNLEYVLCVPRVGFQEFWGEGEVFEERSQLVGPGWCDVLFGLSRGKGCERW